MEKHLLEVKQEIDTLTQKLSDLKKEIGTNLTVGIICAVDTTLIFNPHIP